MGEQSSIGAGWADMSKRSEIPTVEERRAQAALRRKGLPDVRHEIRMRYERVLGVWRVTFTESGKVVRECRFEQDHTLEETIGSEDASTQTL
jgi:hypothetical protein